MQVKNAGENYVSHLTAEMQHFYRKSRKVEVGWKIWTTQFHYCDAQLEESAFCKFF